MKDIKVKVVEYQCIELTVVVGSSDGERDDDDDAMRVRFDDTEGERTTAVDDDFEVIEVDWPKAGTNRI